MQVEPSVQSGLVAPSSKQAPACSGSRYSALVGRTTPFLGRNAGGRDGASWLDKGFALASGLVVGASKLLVVAYRRFLSPLLTPSCRFSPSCSAYALGCLDRHPPLVAYGLILKRIARCHPWGGQGWDPVPERAMGEEQVGEAAHCEGLCSDFGEAVLPCGSSCDGGLGASRKTREGSTPGLGSSADTAVGSGDFRGRNEQG